MHELIVQANIKNTKISEKHQAFINAETLEEREEIRQALYQYLQNEMSNKDRVKLLLDEEEFTKICKKFNIREFLLAQFIYNLHIKEFPKELNKALVSFNIFEIRKAFAAKKLEKLDQQKLFIENSFLYKYWINIPSLFKIFIVPIPLVIIAVIVTLLITLASSALVFVISVTTAVLSSGIIGLAILYGLEDKCSSLSSSHKKISQKISTLEKYKDKLDKNEQGLENNSIKNKYEQLLQDIKSLKITNTQTSLAEQKKIIIGFIEMCAQVCSNESDYKDALYFSLCVLDFNIDLPVNNREIYAANLQKYLDVCDKILPSDPDYSEAMFNCGEKLYYYCLQAENLNSDELLQRQQYFTKAAEYFELAINTSLLKPFNKSLIEDNIYKTLKEIETKLVKLWDLTDHLPYFENDLFREIKFKFKSKLEIKLKAWPNFLLDFLDFTDSTDYSDYFKAENSTEDHIKNIKNSDLDLKKIKIKACDYAKRKELSAKIKFLQEELAKFLTLSASHITEKNLFFLKTLTANIRDILLDIINNENYNYISCVQNDLLFYISYLQEVDLMFDAIPSSIKVETENTQKENIIIEKRKTEADFLLKNIKRMLSKNEVLYAAYINQLNKINSEDQIESSLCLLINFLNFCEEKMNSNADSENDILFYYGKEVFDFYNKSCEKKKESKPGNNTDILYYYGKAVYNFYYKFGLNNREIYNKFGRLYLDQAKIYLEKALENCPINDKIKKSEINGYLDFIDQALENFTAKKNSYTFSNRYSSWSQKSDHKSTKNISLEILPSNQAIRNLAVC